MNAPLFSRGTSTHFLGPCDDELATPMPAELKQKLNAVARVMDPPMTGAELNRQLITDFLYGRIAQVDRIVRRPFRPSYPGKTRGDETTKG